MIWIIFAGQTSAHALHTRCAESDTAAAFNCCRIAFQMRTFCSGLELQGLQVHEGLRALRPWFLMLRCSISQLEGLHRTGVSTNVRTFGGRSRLEALLVDERPPFSVHCFTTLRCQYVEMLTARCALQ